ncbi:hypothetical protein PMIN01_08584 [Paraphaeosphaeria minitans]|uniref:Uncharacterized protein n=1 Tax=Paraphaeosphaeria minitans TaxID=565426 RepID=A0A9P6GC03_9PLEO|nr:hypothetical protein PMIN01_08584 [Paraphaeosphaeria minitans]
MQTQTQPQPQPVIPTPSPSHHCLPALRHAQKTPASQRHFTNLLDSTTNPSHRLLETTIFSLLRRGLSFADIAAFLRCERTRAAQGIGQLRDSARRVCDGDEDGNGVERWVEWRVASWPRWPAGWEVAMLGGWGLEAWAWVVHEAGSRGGTGKQEVVDGMCCHGFAIGERKRGGSLRERLRAMV